MYFRGPALFKDEKHFNKEESYLSRIVGPSSLNWQTFHHVYTALWCKFSSVNMTGRHWNIANITIFWLIADILIVTSNCRCTTDLWGRSGRSIESRCVVKPMIRRNAIATMSLIDSRSSVTSVGDKQRSRSCRKNFENTHEARPSIKDRITNLSMKVQSNETR